MSPAELAERLCDNVEEHLILSVLHRASFTNSLQKLSAQLHDQIMYLHIDIKQHGIELSCLSHRFPELPLGSFQRKV